MLRNLLLVEQNSFISRVNNLSTSTIHVTQINESVHQLLKKAEVVFPYRVYGPSEVATAELNIMSLIA